MALDNTHFYKGGLDKKILELDGWRILFSKKNEPYYRKMLFNEPLRNNGKNYPLRLTLKKEKNKETYKLYGEYSLRKWYFNRNGRRDLYLEELIDCLYKISQLLKLDFEQILSFTITQLELGVTMPFKPIYRNLQSCMISYPYFDRNEKDESLYFRNSVKSSHHIIIYDKLTEIYKKTKNKKLLNDLNEKIFFLRFEHCIKNISKVPFFKTHASTFNDLIFNWDLIMEDLLNQAKRIEYVDWLSDFKENQEDTFQVLNNKIFYNGLQDMTIHKVIKNIDSLKTTNKSIYKKKIINQVELSSQGKYKDLMPNFLSKLETTLQRISKVS